MKFSHKFSWNLFGAAIPLIVGLGAVPSLLRVFGDERFGLLTLIWVLVGYLSLFDLGVGRALTYKVRLIVSSKSSTSGALEAIVSTGMLISFVAGFLGAVCLGLLAESIPKWMSVSDELKSDLVVSFLICAVTVIPIALNAAVRGVLEGMGRFDAANIGRMTVGIGIFVAPLAAHSVGLDKSSLLRDTAFGIFLIRAIVFLFSYVIMKRELQRLDGRVPSVGVFPYRLEYVKSILGYGSWVTITGVVGPLMVFGDRFLISRISGPSALPFYAIPQEFIVKMLVIPTAFFGAVLPNLVGNSGDALREEYRRRVKLNCQIMVGLTGVSLILIYPGLTFWLGAEFSNKAIWVAVLFILGTLVNGLAQGPFTLLLARGRPDLIAKLHLLELVFYLPLVYGAVYYYGIIGAAATWVVRAAIDFVALTLMSSLAKSNV